MSLSDTFSKNGSGQQPENISPKQRDKRLPPFSLRLSADERARLMAEASGAPLGAYIKAKVMGSALPVQMRRTGLSIEDRQALAQVLALLGRSRLANNLNQLAHAANIGTLPLTLETHAELVDSIRAVQGLRLLMLIALGLKSDRLEDRP